MNLFSLLAGSNTLEKPLVADALAIPESLKVEGDFLLFSSEIRKRVAPDAAGLLTAFAGLADTDAHAILRYAKRFGPLGICGRHKLPVFHAVELCWPKRADSGFAEPIATWRRYAKRVSAILSIAAALRRHEPASADAWRPLLPLFGISSLDDDEAPDDDDEAASVHTWLLGQALNDLLDEARPQPAVRLDDAGRLRITFRGAGLPSGALPSPPRGLRVTGRDVSWLSSAGNLLSAIALQTAMAAAGHSGLTRCADCGCLYRPARALPLDRLHFCKKCGRRASRKLYMRRVRNSAEQKKYELLRRNRPERGEP
jgi:hypothetical protein